MGGAKRRKVDLESGSQPTIVYLVTKDINIEVAEFGDLLQAFPDNDSLDQLEDMLKEELEEKIVENHKNIYLSLASAQSAAESLFVEAKTYVNSKGNVMRRHDGGQVRDTSLDPKLFAVDECTWLNEVEFEVDLDGVDESEEGSTNFMTATIKIYISELELVE